MSTIAPALNQTPPNPFQLRRRRNLDLASSMVAGGAGAAPQSPPLPTPELPANYGFGELAGYEEGRRSNFGEQAKREIGLFGSEFEKRASDRRAALVSSLANIGQEQFVRANPFILEDLNKRGLFSSPSAVNQAQTDSLKDIALRNQEKFIDMESNDFNTAEQLRQSGLTAQLQAEQDALDAGLDLRRGGLEAGRADAQASEERRLAEELARQERRSGLTNSLIGAGGSIIGAGLPLLMKGGVAATPEVVGGGGAGMGMAGPIALGIAAQLAQSNLARKRMGVTDREANMLLPIPAGAMQLGAVKGIGKAVEKSGISGQNITGGSVGKAIKKLCFDGDTEILMADGAERRIRDLTLGEETKGGRIESVRISQTSDGTRYNYKGVIVTGSHAVLENGHWRRVEKSAYGIPVSGPGIVYSLVTSDHRIYSGGFTFSDEHESDFYEELTIDQSLDYLNAQEADKALSEAR